MSGNNRVFYWDTCVYYAWLKQEAAYGDFLSGLDDMVLRSKENKIEIITSTITLLEVLDTGLTSQAEITFRQLFEHDIHKAIDVDILVALKAREYRSHYKRKGEAVIESAHHCAAQYVDSTPVFETFQGQVIWEGVVDTFALTGHPKAQRCHAWPFKNDAGEEYSVTVLEIPPRGFTGNRRKSSHRLRSDSPSVNPTRAARQPKAPFQIRTLPSRDSFCVAFRPSLNRQSGVYGQIEARIGGDRLHQHCIESKSRQ